MMFARWVAPSATCGTAAGAYPSGAPASQNRRPEVQPSNSPPNRFDPSRLKFDLDQLNEAYIKAFRNAFLPTRDRPQYVYHYTNIEGLTGILKDCSLWGSDVAYMNDASEYYYADKLIQRAMPALEQQAGLAGDVADNLTSFFLQGPTHLSSRAYAACFCESGDLLSQWRAYSKGGIGYAIEIPLEKLITLFAPEANYATIGRIEYDETRQLDLLKNTITPGMYFPRLTPGAVNQAVAGTLDKYESLDVNRWIFNVKFALIRMRAFLKSWAFHEEREWRIGIVNVYFGEEFHTANGLLVPHLPLKLGEPDRLPITRIIVGPNPHPEQAKDSLERYLRSRKMDHIKVVASPIPVTL
jgi:hypothetical protein